MGGCGPSLESGDGTLLGGCDCGCAESIESVPLAAAAAGSSPGAPWTGVGPTPGPPPDPGKPRPHRRRKGRRTRAGRSLGTGQAGIANRRSIGQNERPPDPDRMCEVGYRRPGFALTGQSNVMPPGGMDHRPALLFPGFACAFATSGALTPGITAAATELLRHRASLIRPPVDGPGILRPLEESDPKRGLLVLDPRIADLEQGAILVGTVGRPMLSFAYRDQVFELPEEWYWNYLYEWCDTWREPHSTSSGRVSSVDDALDGLWPIFKGDARRDVEDYDGLLGCYNLHGDDWEGKAYLFWTHGRGGPYHFFLNAAQLLHAYVEEAEFTDDASQALCVGFAEFLDEMMDGSEAHRSPFTITDSSYPWECSLRLNYRNLQVYPRANEPCHISSTRQDCFIGYNPGEDGCAGVPWDEFSFQWVETGNCYTDSLSHQYTCGAPGTGCDTAGIGGEWNATFHPVTLAFQAQSADQILFLARMCYDYARTRSSVDKFAEYYTTASRISRYALRIIASHARLWIHEIGHVYLGGGHCRDSRNCCFDNAADAWECRVKGFLGLPREVYAPRTSGDYDNPDAILVSLCDSCSSDGGVARFKSTSCDTQTEGVALSESEFLASICYSSTWGSFLCNDGKLPGSAGGHPPDFDEPERQEPLTR